MNIREKSSDLLSLDGKVAVISGGASGIGFGTAHKLAVFGAKVIILDVDSAKGVKAEKELGGIGPEIKFIRCDVRIPGDCKDAVDKINTIFGKIDILVNNAGVSVWKPLKKQTLADIENQIRTNLEGLIKMTWICLPHVKDMIINIASGAGQTGFAELAPYCATKFGVRGFTQALAQEISKPKIYAVNPDMTKTRMTGFQGRPAEEVAQIVLNTAKGKYRKSSGSDINVWDYDK